MYFRKSTFQILHTQLNTILKLYKSCNNILKEYVSYVTGDLPI